MSAVYYYFFLSLSLSLSLSLTSIYMYTVICMHKHTVRAVNKGLLVAYQIMDTEMKRDIISRVPLGIQLNTFVAVASAP